MSSDSEEDQNSVTSETAPQRGRPAGKSDSTKRYRRTAQEISDDKIRIAQMKLDAVREAEERKLANKKSRSRPPLRLIALADASVPRQSRAKAAVEESELPSRAQKK